MTDDHDNVIRFPHCARRVDDLDTELAKLEGLLGTTRMRYYKLDGHIPIRVETLKTWADEVAQHDRITALTGIDPWRVDVTKIDDVVISTVFLGLDYLCLSEIKSGHIRDAIRRRPGGKVTP